MPLWNILRWNDLAWIQQWSGPASADNSHLILRTEDRTSPLCYCICVWVSGVSDAPCDLVWWLWPPGTPRQLAGTGMWGRLKDLSHLKPSSSSSSAATLFGVSSLPLPESYAPQVDNFKAHRKPNATRKEPKMCKSDKSEKGCFWLTMTALHSFQTYRSVSSGLIQNVHSGAHFFVMDVVAAEPCFFDVWTTTFWQKLLLFYGLSRSWVKHISCLLYFLWMIHKATVGKCFLLYL